MSVTDGTGVKVRVGRGVSVTVALGVLLGRSIVDAVTVGAGSVVAASRAAREAGNFSDLPGERQGGTADF